MTSFLIFSAVAGLASGKLGYWTPDTPIDPDNPINPWAHRLIGLIGGIGGGLAVAQTFGLEQTTLGLIGALIGGAIFVDIARIIKVL